MPRSEFGCSDAGTISGTSAPSPSYIRTGWGGMSGSTTTLPSATGTGMGAGEGEGDGLGVRSTTEGASQNENRQSEYPRFELPSSGE